MIPTINSKTSKRSLQVAEEIRVFIAKMFAHGEIRDPRVQGLTIHHVKVPRDLRTANVYYIIPTTADQKAASTSLKQISGYVRKSLGARLSIRHVPEIHFYYDESADHSIKINALISKINQQNA